MLANFAEINSILCNNGNHEITHVLHVDDDQNFLKTTKTILELEYKINATSTDSVDKANELLNFVNFDVIVSDYQMPQKDGLQFLKKLRSNGNDVPFILFTGKGREDIAIKALNLGASGYVNKMGKPETVYGELSHRIKELHKNRKLEAALSKSCNSYQQIFEGANDGILGANPDTKEFVIANPKMCKMLGYSHEELLNLSVMDIHPKADMGFIISSFDNKSLGNIDVSKDIPVLRKDGIIIYCDISSKILEINGEDLLIGFFRDVTDRLNAQKLEKQHLEKYVTLFNSMAQGVFYQDFDGTLIDVNESALEMLGLTKDQFIGRDSLHPDWKVINEMGNLIPPKEHPSMIALKTGKNVKDFVLGVFNPVTNSYRWLNVNAIPQFKRGESEPFQVFVTLHDITKVQVLRNQLSNSEKKFRTLFSTMNEGFCLHQIVYTESGSPIDYRILDVNSSYEKITGIKRIDAINQLASKLYGTGEPPFVNIYAKVAQTGKSEKFEAYFEPMKKAFRISAFSPELGKFATIFSDVTDYYNALKKLEKSEKRANEIAEKLNVIGKISRHDARNKLAVMLNNLYLMRLKLGEESNVLNYLSQIEFAIAQIENIFYFAQTYEKLGAEALSYRNPKKSLEEAARLFGDNGIIITFDCERLKLYSDSLLMQLFYNLMDNSKKHGEHVTTIHVSYELNETSLNLIYEDNGIGIPEKEKKKIFKKGYGKNTGLGLYMITKICHVYGWNIKEEGTPRKGARFIITIPKDKYQIESTVIEM